MKRAITSLFTLYFTLQSTLWPFSQALAEEAPILESSATEEVEMPETQTEELATNPESILPQPEENPLNEAPVTSDPIPEEITPVDPDVTPAEEPQVTEQANPLIPEDPVDEPPAEDLPEASPLIPTLVINEVMLGSEVNPEWDDWIEFYNPGEQDLALSGWQVRGVTKGGLWVDIGTGVIPAKGYYVLSHYSNSASSALATKPQLTKSSIDFVQNPVHIELKNPQGEGVDTAHFDVQNLFNELNQPLYRSYERLSPNSDGTLAESWLRSSSQINLKPNLTSTFASPGTLNLTPSSQEPAPPVPVDPEPLPEPETPTETAPLPTPTLVINEVMLGSEVNAEWDDWIEFYNPGEEEIPLAGWQIRGVTKGGGWIDVNSSLAAAVQPKSYYLLSHYSNSSSSALEIVPNINKTSIDFVQNPVHIELKNPQGEGVDTAHFEVQNLFNELNQPLYRSYERLSPNSDGTLAESWLRSSSQINLKPNLTSTFASPKAPNSNTPLPDPVQNLQALSTPLPCTTEELNCLPGKRFLIHLSWQNSPLTESVKIEQLQANEEGWDQLILLSKNEPSVYELPVNGLEEVTFRFTPLDTWGRAGEDHVFVVNLLPTILINEVLPDPKTEETLNEFVELYNAGTVEVDLYGAELTDETTSYFFTDEKKNYHLKPGQYLLLYKSETEIDLANLGDGVSLYNEEGKLLDEYFYAPHLEGHSWGRSLKDWQQWETFFHPTPGGSNVDFNTPPVPIFEFQKSSYMTVNVTAENSYDAEKDALSFWWDFGDGFTSTEKNPGTHVYETSGFKTIRLTVTDAYGDSVNVQQNFEAKSKLDEVLEEELKSYPTYSLINEFLVNPEGEDEPAEWVEIYNNTNSVIDLSGWYLDDDEKGSSPEKLAEGTKIGPGQFLLFYPGLSFKNSEDVVRLLNPNKEPTQIVSYTQAQEAKSYAKTPQGDFAWTPLLTPLKPNAFPPPLLAYAPESVTFQRVLPNPSGADGNKEKVVIKNNLPQSLSLEGWVLQDAGGHKKTLSGPLAAQATLTLVGDEIGFSLNNSDEELLLYDGLGNLIDSIHWGKIGSGQWLIDPDMFYEGMQVKVVRTVDGDTFELDLGDGTRIKSRLLGVDTPETVHPFKPLEFYGKEASQFLKSTLTGQTVTLRFDANKFDKYGRLLAYVYLPDNTLVNAQIIQQGYGYAYTRFPFLYLDDFVRYEEEAKAAGRGLWEHEEIREAIEALIEEEKIKWEEEDLLQEIIPEEEFVILEEEVLIEEVPEEITETLAEEAKMTDKPTMELTAESLEEWLECSLGNLRIEAFMPNPGKGKEEWIRLANNSDHVLCLEGWQLDDIENEGSKPFILSAEKLEPGETRLFLKSETKLNLNNKNDSVRLLNPLGKEVQRVDYGIAHAGETFTPKGGDWKAKKRAKKAPKPKAKRHKFDREKIAYQYEWVNRRLIGSYELAPEKEGLYIQTEKNERFFVHFPPEQVDWEMLTLLNETGKWEFQLHEDDFGKELVAVAPVEQFTEK